MTKTLGPKKQPDPMTKTLGPSSSILIMKANIEESEGKMSPKRQNMTMKEAKDTNIQLITDSLACDLKVVKRIRAQRAGTK
jgi:hypothetical protein